MRRLLLIFAALLPAYAGAQATGTTATPKSRAPGMEVRQYTLQVLSGSDAQSLLAPFVPVEGGGGVWRSSGTVITVIGSKRTLAVADSVLKLYDHQPTTLALRFMLIEASDSAVSDGRIGEVEAELRKVLKFNGYRLMAEATALVAEAQGFTSTMSTADHAEFTVDGGVKTVREGSVGIGIALRSGTKGLLMGTPTSPDTRQLLATSLTVPIGQTAVLGTAANDKGIAALILTVRPELSGSSGAQPGASQARERTFEFKVHSNAASFEGLLRVLGDSMEVEALHGYCVYDPRKSDKQVKRFNCEGLSGVGNVVLHFYLQNVRDASEWTGFANEEQTNGPECTQYRQGVCIAWKPTVNTLRKRVGGRILLKPKSP